MQISLNKEGKEVVLADSISFSEIHKNPIIKDISYLTNVIPPDNKFLHRTKEANEIIIKLQPILHAQRATNFFMYGLKGTGKTALILAKLKELKNYLTKNCKAVKYKSLYINCGSQGMNNEVNVMACILKQLNPELKLAKTGLTKNYVRLTFEEILLKEKFNNVVIVLDEFDALLMSKDGDALLYYFSRLKDTEPFFDIHLTTIIISNQSRVKSFLMERTESSFGRDRVDFFQYDPIQLKDILEFRSKQALKKGVLEAGVIDKIACLIAQRDGDCRKALELLAKCCTIALSKKQKNVTLDLIDGAMIELEQDLYLMIIKKMSVYQQILFLALLYAIKNGKPDSSTTYKLNRELCERSHKKVLCTRQLQNFLHFYEDAGLIDSEVTYNPTLRKKTKLIKLAFEKDLIDKAINILSQILSLTSECPKENEDLRKFTEALG